MSFSESQFTKLSTQEMWNEYSKLKVNKDSFDKLSVQLSTTVAKIDKLEQTVTKLSSELAISKTVNQSLKRSYCELQSRVNQIDQYSRRENIEISGVPNNCTQLEEKVIALLKSIDVTVRPSDIVACHPLKREGTTIVRFLNRKNADMALKNAKKLKNKDTSEVWGKNCKNFINVNLSPANLKLRWLCKSLKERGLVYGFGVDSRGVWYRTGENGTKTRVEIKEDLEKFLPAQYVSLEDFLKS